VSWTGFRDWLEEFLYVPEYVAYRRAQRACQERKKEESTRAQVALVQLALEAIFNPSEEQLKRFKEIMKDKS